MKMLLKRGLYPALAIALLLLGGAVWLFSRFEISIEEVSPPDPTPAPIARTSPPTPKQSPLNGRSPAPTVAATPSPPPAAPTTPSPPPATSTAQQGKLRVSNQTEHPIRVALLTQTSGGSGGNSRLTYGEPVHWDFAPQEGSEKGLLLALPDQELNLKAGDILVAFAQDGSRLYWGPHVVGKTAQPVWNAQMKEWQLILQ